MDPWDQIRRAVADTRSGSVEIAVRAANGIADLRGKRDVVRATRALVRAHPAMAGLWRLGAEAYDAPDVEAAAHGFAARLEATTGAAADAVRWVVTRRNQVVLTHSASGSVVRALERVRSRIARVLCTASLPGGEGRALARRLERAGFEVEVVPDAAVAEACARAHVALVGADAVTPDGIVNKVGTRVVALCAADARIGCYAIASSLKLLPAVLWDPAAAPAYELTPLRAFDAVVTEAGPRRAAAIARAAARVEIPAAIARLG